MLDRFQFLVLLPKYVKRDGRSGSDTSDRDNQTDNLLGGLGLEQEDQDTANKGSDRLSGRKLLASDGFLHTYDQADVDWRDLWAIAAVRRNDVPPCEKHPYWAAHGPDGRQVPISVLAFWGAADRERIACDPETEWVYLAYMKDDPNLAVVRAAANNVKGWRSR